jgi:D-alanyl-D-alanine carboxypeptidase/D-alanyl-D-alanine-endopeptidase (penicillin-binding protein 4)
MRPALRPANGPSIRLIGLSLAFLVVFAAVGLVAPAGAAEDDPLPRELSKALAARALRGARVGALVVDQRSGRVLFGREAERALVPASNLKVLTALAALHALGPTHRFVTSVHASGPPNANGSVGTLYLRGGGDPALTSEDFWRLAADLRKAGLREVTEGIVLDDSVFDRERWHPSWKGVGSRAYHAPVGALTVNYGAFAVVVAPSSKTGSPVATTIDPVIPFLQLTNRASTGPPRSRLSLKVDRKAMGESDRIVVSGHAPSSWKGKTYHRSVSDPARYAGNVFAMQLAAVGIEVKGPIQLGGVPAAAGVLLEFEGQPLAEVVRRFLKYSNNSIGEGLVKALGARSGEGPGSWPLGIEAVRAELVAAGVSTEGISMVDGSGLSYENRVSPRTLVDTVRVGAGSFQFGPEFLAGLPIAGRDGTLQERAEAATQRARAKTGLLNGVTGLSGLAERPDGSVVVFSVLVNGFKGSARSAMDALDGFVAVLVDGGSQHAAKR